MSGQAPVLDLTSSSKPDCLSCLAASITARLKSRTTQRSICTGTAHYLVSLTQTPTSMWLLAERFESGVCLTIPVMLSNSVASCYGLARKVAAALN